VTRLEEATVKAALALLQAGRTHAWAAVALLEDHAAGAGAVAIGLLRRAEAADISRRADDARHLRAQAEASLLASLPDAATDAAA
jgi:hypothetical protein